MMDALLHLLLLLDVTHFSKFLCYQILLYDTFKYFIIMYFKPFIYLNKKNSEKDKEP